MAKNPAMMIDGKFPRLSKREKHVFKRMIEDAKNKEIASELDLNEKTISTYKLRVCTKLKCKGPVEMYFFNLKYKLVEINFNHSL